MTPEPMTETQLYELLDEMGIETSTVAHEAVFTVNEGKHIKETIPGGHTKNLFIKDKKDNYFLIVAEGEASIPINALHGILGARSRLSFASADRLRQILGVEPGSVTAFAAANDREGKVKVVIDASLMAHDLINCHPLTNTKTTTISRKDLVRFLEKVDHPPAVLELSRPMDYKPGE